MSVPEKCPDGTLPAVESAPAGDPARGGGPAAAVVGWFPAGLRRRPASGGVPVSRLWTWLPGRKAAPDLDADPAPATSAGDRIAPCEATPPPTPPVSPPPSPDDEDGEVTVREGRVEVRNPRGRGRWPHVVVPPGGGIELRVNGRPVGGEAVLRAEDQVVLLTREHERRARVEIAVADDELHAWATVWPAVRVTTVLRQPVHGTRIELESTEVRETLPVTLTPADVRAALVAEGVQVKPDAAAVAHALATPGERVAVAGGHPPEPGSPAHVWSCVHGDMDGPPAPVGAVHRPAGPADPAGPAEPAAAAEAGGPAPRGTTGGAVPDGAPAWVDHLPGLRPVAVGEPLAQVGAGRPTRAGLTVTGRVVGEPVWAPTLVAGPNAILSSDGQTAIAAAAGRPEVVVDADRVWVAVHPALRVPGDVGDGRGDIEFEGDVWVAGSVLAGHAVRAAGDIVVEGHATRARLVAGGGITVHGGVASSLVLGGGAGLCYVQALPLCRELQSAAARLRTRPDPGDPGWRQLSRLAARLAAIFGEAAGDGIPLPDPEVAELIRLLPDVAGPGGSGTDTLPARAPARAAARAPQAADGSVRTATAAVRTDPAAAVRADPAAAVALRAARTRLRPPDGLSLARAAQAAGDCMEVALGHTVPCFVQYLDNSRIETTGDVTVGPPGASRSHVVTQGSLAVDGAFRGGSAWAAGGARFASLGSPDGVPTRVEIGVSAALHAAQVHAGASVVQGRRRRDFDRPAADVWLRPLEREIT